MEYKFYVRADEGYVLKKQTGLLIFVYGLFFLLGILGIWYAISQGKSGGYLWALVCFGFIAIGYVRRQGRGIHILPEKQIVVVKLMNKKKEYLFKDFLNFQKTRITTNGIVTQWQVSMFFDQNGKNKNILLGTFFYGKKKANALIEETSALMKKGSSAINQTLNDDNRYRYN